MRRRRSRPLPLAIPVLSIATWMAFPVAAQQVEPVAAEEEAAGADEKRKAARLAAGAARMDDIVVTASRRAQAFKEAPASISVITREDLEKRPVADLTDALRDVEGLVTTGGSNDKDLYVRGLPGAYTLILVDGKRQSTRDSRTNGNAGFEQSFTPPAEAIERIEVVRGPMSSLYGSDAIGGVINIITRKVPERWGGSLGLDAVLQEYDESGDWHQAQLYVAGPLVADKLGLQAWGRAYERDEDQILAGTWDQRDHNLTGRLSWTPTDTQELMLQVDSTDVRRGASAGANLAANGVDNYSTNQRDAQSLSHKGRWGWGNSSLSVLHEDTQRDVYRRNTAGDFVPDLRAPQIENTVVDLLMDAALGAHTFAFGGQYLFNDLTDINPGVSATTQRNFEIWQRAVFIEDEWRLHPRFAFTGGVRLDDHKIYGEHVSPRLYAVWNTLDTLTLKGGVSTGFRAPEVRQIAPGYAYTTGGGGCTVGPQGTCGVIVADPDLKPETSINYELSAMFEPSRLYSVGVTLFRTEFEDKIDSNIVYDQNGAPQRWPDNPNYRLYYWFNLNDATVNGAELTATWQPLDTLRFKLGYTFSESEQASGTYKGYPLARSPKHMGNLRADYRVSEQLSAWAAGFHHGSEINAGLRVGTNGQPIYENGAIVARRYPNYTTADVGLSYKASRAVTLKVAVQNVADKRLDVIDYDTVGDGRRYWLNSTISF